MTQDAEEFAPWLGVFETLRVVDGVPLFLAQHREELVLAMTVLGLDSVFDFEKARKKLPLSSGRWRWIVTPEGTRTLFTEEETPPSEPVAMSISPVRVGSNNWDARYKTVSYLAHIQAGRTATTPEVVLLNENGHVASAARGNIFWRKGDTLRTPSHEAGCRRGVVRRFIVDRHRVKIGQFRSEDLLKADEIFLTNSMKGIVSVNRIEKRDLTDFSTADKLREEYEAEIKGQMGG